MGKKKPDKKALLEELRQQAEQADYELEQALSQPEVSVKLTAYTKWVSAILTYRQKYEKLNKKWPEDSIVSILKIAAKIASCDIRGTAQFLPEPPKIDWSDKHQSELLKFYNWGIDTQKLVANDNKLPFDTKDLVPCTEVSGIIHKRSDNVARTLRNNHYPTKKISGKWYCNSEHAAIIWPKYKNHLKKQQE